MRVHGQEIRFLRRKVNRQTEDVKELKSVKVRMTSENARLVKQNDVLKRISENLSVSPETLTGESR